MKGYIWFAAAAMALGGVSRADTVELSNGDKITGKVGTIAAGKMEFVSPSLGKLLIDMDNVKSFVTDEAATIRTKKSGITTDRIVAGDAEQITTAGGATVPRTDLKDVNPPAQEWTGSILGTFNLQRGNTNSYGVGVNGIASLRRDDEDANDRTTLTGGYNYGESGGGPGPAPRTVDTDNWNATAKYDRFWSEKWYGYASLRVEHDRIALLNYRLTPGIGIGYQWWERPDSKFSTEAGFSFIHEDYDPGDTNNEMAVRLAYHYDRRLTEKVMLFHNLEYLPAIQDPGDFLLITDVGVRSDVYKNMFVEARFVWEHDSSPAEGAQKDDLQYLLGLGWRF